MDISRYIKLAEEGFSTLQHVPAPRRGELIRVFGDELRRSKEQLARVITKCCYKTIRESRGEVQEAIDMCDFAVGLSRQLYGLTMSSERPYHRIQEQWLPLGPIGVITAFNFPLAVWAWNFCIGVVCGNSVIWKPSPQGVEVTEFVQQMWERACGEFGDTRLCEVSVIIVGGPEAGKALAADNRVRLISATGSTKMGREVAKTVSGRLGRVLLELGGNNAAVVSQHCDFDVALKSCVFGAVGTSGQRCTTTRRIYVHDSLYEKFIDKLTDAYKTISIGDPLNETTLMGPLINHQAFLNMNTALAEAVRSGGQIVYGGERVYPTPDDDRVYVNPCIVTTHHHFATMMEETFAPIVYVMPYNVIHQATRLVNATPYGLSSSIFTNNIIEAELFMRNVDCGLVNVNAGTSGAEIGGAFGGEKDTGGGRESGSDSWKQYMRRVTSTINYSQTTPLAQDITFE